MLLHVLLEAVEYPAKISAQVPRDALKWRIGHEKQIKLGPESAEKFAELHAPLKPETDRELLVLEDIQVPPERFVPVRGVE